MGREKLVERNDVAVLFRRSTGDQAGITAAWAAVETAIGSLKGRKFYGAYDPATHEYRVCVKRRDGDDAQALGLEEGTLPGGRYARLRLEGEPPAVYAEIRPGFGRLLEHHAADGDPARPSIEYYRRRDVIDLLLPIADPAR